MDREVDETDTFLLAINVCHAIQSTCSTCHDFPTVDSKQYSSRLQPCAVKHSIQDGGKFDERWCGAMVAKDSAVLRYSQIITDADLVPFKYSFSILSTFSLKSFIDINCVR